MSRFMPTLNFVMLLPLALLALAAGENVASAVVEESVPQSEIGPWESTFNFDSILGASGQSFRQTSPFNPDNQVFQLSRSQGTIFLRPGFKISKNRYAFVVRPRLTAVTREAPVSNLPNSPVDSKASYIDLYTNEVFAKYDQGEYFQIALGRQNYQWGPAEILSPTNFMLNELTSRAEPYYEVRGVNMARVNLSFGGAWSWVTLAELPPLGDSSYGLSQHPVDGNEKRWLTKLDYNCNGGANFLGLEVGSRTRDRAMSLIGTYGAWAPTDAWQFYADAITGKGSDVPYPDATGVPSTAEIESSKIYTLGVIGLRYTFAGGTEWRIEQIRNDYGFTSAQQRDYLNALKRGGLSQYLALQGVHSGRTMFYGTSYSYAAVRWAGTSKYWRYFHQPSLAIRALLSNTDGSAFTSATFETGLSDQIAIATYAGVATGADDSELTRVNSGVWGISLKHSY